MVHYIMDKRSFSGANKGNTHLHDKPHDHNYASKSRIKDVLNGRECVIES